MILGVTGSFGCGKSTVLSAFSAAGWFVFDADRCCHDLYENPPPALHSGLRDAWGEDIFSASGSLDRRELGRIVFSDAEALEKLTALVYPLLFAEMRKQFQVCREAGRSGAFEVPLLFECGLGKEFDAVLTVWAKPEIRQERLRGRGYDEEEFRRREARQMAPDMKLERADYALVNNGSREELQEQIHELIATLSR